MNDSIKKQPFDFETHVKFILREKAPKTGAVLIQTTSKDFGYVMRVVQTILDNAEVDTSDRPINGHVRIVFQLCGYESDTIHTYDMPIMDLYKVITSGLNAIDPKMIHKSHTHEDMNWKHYP